MALRRCIRSLDTACLLFWDCFVSTMEERERQMCGLAAACEDIEIVHRLMLRSSATYPGMLPLCLVLGALMELCDAAVHHATCHA